MSSSNRNDFDRAFLTVLYQQIAERGERPYIHVFTHLNGVQVPSHLDRPYDARDPKPLVLNLSMEATTQLFFGPSVISFGGTFGGRHYSIVIPYSAVQALLGHKSGVGYQRPLTTDGRGMLGTWYPAPFGISGTDDVIELAAPQPAAASSDPNVTVNVAPPQSPQPAGNGSAVVRHLKLVK